MAVSDISAAPLAKVLKDSYNQSVVFQGSNDTRDFDVLLQRKVGNIEGQAQQFEIQGSLGSAAVQWSAIGTGGNYPEGQVAGLSVKRATFKEINATITIHKAVWDAAVRSPSDTFINPVKLEAESKAIAHKRRMSVALHGDGTGVLGEVVSAAVVGGNLEVQLSTLDSARGFVGFFEFDDILVLKSASGLVSAIDTNLAVEPAYWSVVDKIRSQDKVILRPMSSPTQPIVGLVSLSTSPAVGEVFYPYAQPTFPDLTTAIIDYGSASEVMAGLESLCAFDGRSVHGVQMSGATGATHLNAQAAPIDSTFIQAIMSQIKTRVGFGRYRYDTLMTAPEVYDTIINAGEVDRRFMVVDDIKRGSRKFVYQHQSDSLELVTSEFCPKKRIRLLPSVVNKKGVLELRMTNFDMVEVDGISSHLGVNAAGHTKVVKQYMTGYGTMINLHPAACGTIHNFVL
jgi:hypothetical protein